MYAQTGSRMPTRPSPGTARPRRHTAERALIAGPERRGRRRGVSRAVPLPPFVIREVAAILPPGMRARDPDVALRAHDSVVAREQTIRLAGGTGTQAALKRGGIR